MSNACRWLHDSADAWHGIRLGVLRLFDKWLVFPTAGTLDNAATEPPLTHVKPEDMSYA